jgi:folate-binding protein YgfZ
VFRTYREGADAGEGAEAWRALRIENGVAESGEDYALNDAFPHDVLLDQLGGVGFGKGCYVGQEVVSRMQHRGTARRRVLIVTAAADLPVPGTEIVAAGRTLGTLGSVSGASGLAILRIDRVKDALDAGVAITADGVPVGVEIPAFASFGFPVAGGDEA